MDNITIISHGTVYSISESDWKEYCKYVVCLGTTCVNLRTYGKIIGHTFKGDIMDWDEKQFKEELQVKDTQLSP